MDFTALISNALGAIKEFFGFARQRDAEKNAPDMKQAKEAQAEAAEADRTRQALAANNLDELRKEAAE